MIHGCDIDPADIEETDEDCLVALERNIAVEDGPYYLTSGSFGAAIAFAGSIPELFGDKRQLVIKYGFHVDRETPKACTANTYRNQSPLFVRVYGWAKCNSIPFDWLPKNAYEIDTGSKFGQYLYDLVRQKRQFITALTPPAEWNLFEEEEEEETSAEKDTRKRKRSSGTIIPTEYTVYYLFSEYAGVTIGDLQQEMTTAGIFTLPDARCMAFDFLYGLLVARRESGTFIHNDIKNDNVTVHESKGRVPTHRHYTVGSSTVFNVSSGYQVKLIDLDHALIGENAQHSNDIIDFFSTGTPWAPAHDIMNMLPDGPQTREWVRFCRELINENLPIHRSDNTRDLELMLLQHPFFEPLRVLVEPAMCKICSLVRTPTMCSACAMPICALCFDHHKTLFA